MTSPPLVTVIAYDRLWSFELAMTTVFALPWPEPGRRPYYRYAIVSADPQPVAAFGGFSMARMGDLALAASADLVIVPGWRDPDEVPDADLLDVLRRAHDRGARIATLWDGVFVLAHAGLLDGRSATTHWQLTDKLAADFPRVNVVRDILYTRDGNIMTSAGCLAGIDMLLAIIRDDYGAAVANRYAGRMIAPPHRAGEQSQRTRHAVPGKDGDRIGSLVAWMERHLAESMSVATLARRAAMSPRTFSRRFREATGMAPMTWLTAQRIRHAQLLLETGKHPVGRVAELSGFGSPETLRHHFRRLVGISPGEWRRAFSPLHPAISAGD